MTRALFHSSLTLLVVALLAGTAAAESVPTESDEGRMEPAPPELDGVDLEEKHLAALPLDREFVDETGAPIRLGDLFDDGLPVILTFNYSNCPMLCSVQLGGLVDTMRKMDWSAGEQFRIITIGLDPDETHRKAMDSKLGYLERYQRPKADLGWRFLTGDEADIRAVADAVGFGYRYHPERDEFLHPAVLTLVSPVGKVSGYLYGVAYEPEALRSALEAAVVGQVSESAKKFILSCFHYEAPTGFAAVAQKVMRYGGIAFVIGFVAVLGVLRRRRRASNQEPPGE